MHAPALILCMLTSGSQRGGAYCSPWVSLILKILWNPSLFFSNMVFLIVCDCGFDCVLRCKLILGDCKKYSPVKCNFLEGEFYISHEVKTERPDSKNIITGYAALLSDEGTWGPCHKLKMQYENFGRSDSFQCSVEVVKQNCFSIPKAKRIIISLYYGYRRKELRRITHPPP